MIFDTEQVLHMLDSLCSGGQIAPPHVAQKADHRVAMCTLFARLLITRSQWPGVV